MTAVVQVADLAILVADKDMESAVTGLLTRRQALRLPPLTFQLYVHPERDPGCLKKAHEFLRHQQNRFRHALVLFDHEGCGRDPSGDARSLEARVTQNLAQAGWKDRAAALVIVPELEVWVWSDSPRVDEVLGWSGRIPDLRTWLRQEKWLAPGTVKPARPKEAMAATLRYARKPRSAALFRELASRVSLDRCIDSSFLRLKRILQDWFGRDTPGDTASGYGSLTSD